MESYITYTSYENQLSVNYMEIISGKKKLRPSCGPLKNVTMGREPELRTYKRSERRIPVIEMT